MSLLEIQNLTVEYVTDKETVHAVNNVSFAMDEGETVGLVGETGAGKTTMAYSIMQILPVPPAVIRSGKIQFKGQDLVQLTDKEMQKIRGSEISIIFQDPMTALNPILPVGEQIEEVLMIHKDLTRAEATIEACKMLEKVGIPAERATEYPHQFSGGMKQRVVIAIALACNPSLLIADEPTTALDVTIQAQVIDMMNELKKELNTSIILITHDLGIVAEMCDKVGIVYAGEFVEFGAIEKIFDETAHPYTQGLFDSIPHLEFSEKRLKVIKGLMPNPADLPSGCKFHERCSYCREICETTDPSYQDLGDGHIVKCHFPLKK